MNTFARLLAYMTAAAPAADRAAPAVVAGAARSPRWPAVRATHLKANPVCLGCGRRDFLEVHHRRPYHLYPELELAPANLLTLCAGPTACHYVVGHGLDWTKFVPDPAAAAREYAAFLDRLRKASAGTRF